MASSICHDVLSLADCLIPRASCFFSARLIPQSSPLLCQNVFGLLRPSCVSSRTEVDRFLEDTRVGGYAAKCSVQVHKL